jgi:enoyl-CoA hydratase/carnithine racemase
MTAKLKLAVADGVATISLNRPERHNAVDDELHDGLAEVWTEVLADPAARVILLRGEGRSFCSGRDTAQLGQRTAGESDLAFIRRHQDTRVLQLASPKPVIAALRGHVLGGGLEMALAADIRIAAADVRMAFPEIGYGLMTDTGGSPLATMLAGPVDALAMIKQTVDGIWHGALHGALRAELLSQVALFGGTDYQARRRARLDEAP